MPQAGTRKVIVGGHEEYQPEDVVALADLIALGLAATEEVEVAQRRLDGIKAQVLEHLESKRNGRASVKFEGLHGGVVAVTWATEKRIDHDLITQLEGRMAADDRADLFVGLFDKETVYRFKRDAARFTKAAGRQLDPYLKLLALAITVKPKNPAVKFLGNAASEVAEGDDA